MIRTDKYTKNLPPGQTITPPPYTDFFLEKPNALKYLYPKQFSKTPDIILVITSTDSNSSNGCFILKSIFFLTVQQFNLLNAYSLTEKINFPVLKKRHTCGAYYIIHKIV